VRVVPPASPEGAIAPPLFEKALHLHHRLETRNPTKSRRRVHSSRIMRGAPAILMRDESHAFDPHRDRTIRLNKFGSCLPMPHPRLLYGTPRGCSSAIRNPMFDQLDFRPQCAGVASLLTVTASGGMRPSRQELPRRRALIEDLEQHADRPILPAGRASSAPRCRSARGGTTSFPGDFCTLINSLRA
jgi:hypothetical protein